MSRNGRHGIRSGRLLIMASALSPLAFGQYTITTIAGGGPPSVAASASIAVGFPYAVAADAAGNVYFTSSNQQRLYRATPDGRVSTIAGTGTAGFSGDGGPASSAQLSQPNGVAVDSAGNVYVSDSGNARVRKISGGIINTVAGNGLYGYSGDLGPATSAQLTSPMGLAVDNSGNLYIADYNNQRIRKVSAGTITTVAGNGTLGYSGDLGAATAAQFSWPSAVAVDSSGNLYIADSGNYRVRKVSGGIITTVAGNGSCCYSGENLPAVTSSLGSVMGVAVDSVGTLYIADVSNSRIRKVVSGVMSTAAGGGGGCAQQVDSVGDGCPAASAILRFPNGVAVDTAGNPYIADSQGSRIRKIAAGVISTVAGNGSFQNSGDNGMATAAQFWPRAVAATGQGSFLIADSIDFRVRAVTGGFITAAAGDGSCCYTGENVSALSAVNPAGVAADTSGNFYVAEGQRVRKVSGGLISTIAGNGFAGFGGDNGPAANALLSGASAVTVDGAGNVYIADTGNNRVRKVTTGGVITTVAGGGPGNGASATAISLGNPVAVAVDAAGNVYVPSPGDHRVYRISTSGILTVVAGNGTPGFSGDNGPPTSAQLNDPYGVAVNSAGTVLYIADRMNNRVRMVSGGTIVTVAGGGSGCAQQTNSVGDGCPGTSGTLHAPSILALDSAGTNLYIADALNYRIRKLSAGVITTVAGNGTCCYSGDNGPATSAQVNYATGIALDNNTGALYIGDSENFRVRQVLGGTITTIAGTGSYGYSGDNGPAVNAALGYCYGVAVDTAGNVYVADASNHRIRRISGGVITTVAGLGANGYSGDNGAATSAQLNVPYDVALDGAGNLYIADTNNYRIRKVTGGTISTIAGNGSASFSGDGGPATDAQLSGPTSVAVDAAGYLYISDSSNLRVRRVAGGVITTVAGNGVCCYSGDNGPATSAQISYSGKVAVASNGTLFLTDQSNRVRMVSGGTITTIAGNGGYGFSGDGGPAVNAALSNPEGISVDSAGNIYVADGGNGRIRLLTPNPKIIGSITPPSAGAGTAGFTLAVNGAGFVSGDVVQWNGTALPTTLLNAGQLTAPVASSQLLQAGTIAVTVNGVSNAVAFTIAPPVVPVLSAVSPQSVPVNSASTLATLNGSSFISGATVQWTTTTGSHVSLPASFISAAQLQATLPASFFSTAGTAQVAIVNPLNQVSNRLPFVITPATLPAVAVGGVAPGSGSGAAGTFSGVWTAANGFTDLRWVQMLFAAAPDGGGQTYCFVHYDVPGNGFWLYGDGGFFVGPFAPGAQTNQLQNSLCSLNNSASSATGSGNALTVNASIVFKGAGARNIYMRGQSMSGSDTGWVQVGAWSLAAAAGPTMSLSPNSGIGSTQTFTLTYPDPPGFAGAAFGWVQFLVAASSNGGGQPFCFLHYDRAGNGLWMYSSDVGFFLGPVAPGTASNALNSSACSVNPQAVTVTNSGGNLVVTAPLTLKGPMSGAKFTFQRTLDVLNRDTGWQQTGVWTIP